MPFKSGNLLKGRCYRVRCMNIDKENTLIHKKVINTTTTFDDSKRLSCLCPQTLPPAIGPPVCHRSPLCCTVSRHSIHRSRIRFRAALAAWSMESSAQAVSMYKKCIVISLLWAVHQTDSLFSRHLLHTNKYLVVFNRTLFFWTVTEINKKLSFID